MNRTYDIYAGMLCSILFHGVIFGIFDLFTPTRSFDLYIFHKGISAVDFTLISDNENEIEIQNEDMLVTIAENEDKLKFKEQASLNADTKEKGVEEFSSEFINIHPHYPLGSRIRGEEGNVKLNVIVDENGRAQEVILLNSSGYWALDKAAIDAFKSADFARSGLPQKKSLLFTVCFKLKNN